MMSWLLVMVSVATILVTGAVVGGLIAGYRPVVLLTGSMGDTAPPRSLIVAEPRNARSVTVGDILVMRRPGEAPITHRVIEIEANGGSRFAITQGDANEAPDAAPYPLDGGQELVGRWIYPRLGGWVMTVFQPGPALALVALATIALTFQALRWIWNGSSATSARSSPAGSTSPRNRVDDGVSRPGRRVRRSGRGRRRRRLATLGVAPMLTMAGLGVAWALFTTTEAVPDNVFGSAECFDPQLASVQDGESIHAVSGTVTVPITAVDPAKSFVLASVRSAGNEPADATAQVRLAADGSAVEIVRTTDNGSPPPVVVAWSVVEYGCGVSVQRGVVSGTGASSVTVPLSTVDPTTSFVTVSSAPPSTATSFDDDDLVRADLGAGTDLVIESAGAVLGADRSFAWQVVMFADPADAVVQTVDVTLGVGVTANTAVLASPVEVNNTFLLASVTSASTGADIGERLVRARLTGSTTVELTRSVGGDAVDVRIQVVDLRDGTTVRHGVVDFAVGEASKPIPVDPFDPGRATAIATVAVPGPVAGGRTDQVADDVVGEASATFAITDGTTVTAERAATASNASFGWQLIEWAGPGWWDSNYLFRQRIDVETSTAAAPNGYTVPVTFDHDALIGIGAAAGDGSDIRVMRWDGSSWVELDRVLEDGSNWGQTDTTILFRTEAAIGADDVSSYWLYFGNPSPAAVLEDPENVFLLTENFDTGTLGDFEDRTGGTAWYSADPWTRRIPLTVAAAQVGADLADFPLLVSISDGSLAVQAQPDGSDIRFVAADGTTPLDHEIERFDPGTGTLQAWVRIPVLSSSVDTTIYLLFGAADAPDQQDVRNTWAQAAAAAWHLGRNPAGTAPQIDDSTVNNLDGLSQGAMTAGDLVAGRVGQGLDFDGADDWASVAPVDFGGRGALTMAAWVRADSVAADSGVVTKRGAATWFDLSVAAGGTASATVNTSGDGEVTVSGGTVTTGTWHHLAATWNGTVIRLYVDGVEVAQQPAAGLLPASTDAMAIGAAPGGADPFDGVIDEVRLVTAVRSPDWLAAEVANHADPASFAVTGPVEVGTWLDAGTWAYRKPIVIDADRVDADVTDFVLYLSIDDTDVQAGAQADGDDLVITAADGVTRLDHALESYNPAAGSVRAWVRVPSISSVTDTELYLYYGNPAAVDQQDRPGTFGPETDLAFLGAP